MAKAATKQQDDKLEPLAFLNMIKGCKSFADLEKKVEKAGYETKGIRLRLASLRNGGIVIPELEGEAKAKQETKSRKEKMMELATAAGFKFDPKKFVERKKKGSTNKE